MNFRNIVLYHFPATRSARVLWALYETVQEGFEVRRVHLNSKAQHEYEYLNKNPNHNVPMLEVETEDGTTHQILESTAIVEWLIDAHPEKQLAPAIGSALARADYLQMLHFGGTWVDMMLWQIRVHEHVLPSDQVDDRTIARYRHKFTAEVEPQIKARLEKTGYISGETFSGADIVMGHNITWARAYGLCQEEIFRQYLSRISKRPAFAKAFEDAREFDVEVSDRDNNTKFTG